MLWQFCIAESFGFSGAFIIGGNAIFTSTSVVASVASLFAGTIGATTAGLSLLATSGASDSDIIGLGANQFLDDATRSSLFRLVEPAENFFSVFCDRVIG